MLSLQVGGSLSPLASLPAGWQDERPATWRPVRHSRSLFELGQARFEAGIGEIRNSNLQSAAISTRPDTCRRSRLAFSSALRARNRMELICPRERERETPSDTNGETDARWPRDLGSLWQDYETGEAASSAVSVHCSSRATDWDWQCRESRVHSAQKAE